MTSLLSAALTVFLCVSAARADDWTGSFDAPRPTPLLDALQGGAVPRRPVIGPARLIRSWQDTTVPPFPVVSDPSKPWLKSDAYSLIVDLRSQWSDPVHRDQGEFGTCAAFATVALFEAAMARGVGKCLRLSEADLFLQGQVLRWRCWDSTESHGKGTCSQKLEGATLREMIDHAQDHGVLRGDHYDEFLKTYQDALKDQGVWKGGVWSNPRAADWFQAFLANPFRYAPLFANPKSEVHEELERYTKVSRLGNVDVQRRGVAQVLRAFKVVYKLGATSEPWSLSNRDCREAAKDMETFIDGELLQGRPVAVGAYLDGMVLWQDTLGADDRKLNSSHAFVINGLEVFRAGREVVKRYHVRNSWGRGEDYSLEADRICHIDEAASLLAPGERPAPGDPWGALAAGARKQPER